MIFITIFFIFVVFILWIMNGNNKILMKNYEYVKLISIKNIHVSIKNRKICVGIDKITMDINNSIKIENKTENDSLIKIFLSEIQNIFIRFFYLHIKDLEMIVNNKSLDISSIVYDEGYVRIKKINYEKNFIKNILINEKTLIISDICLDKNCMELVPEIFINKSQTNNDNFFQFEIIIGKVNFCDLMMGNIFVSIQNNYILFSVQNVNLSASHISEINIIILDYNEIYSISIPVVNITNTEKYPIFIEDLKNIMDTVSNKIILQNSGETKLRIMDLIICIFYGNGKYDFYLDLDLKSGIVSGNINMKLSNKIFDTNEISLMYIFENNHLSTNIIFNKILLFHISYDNANKIFRLEIFNESYLIDRFDRTPNEEGKNITEYFEEIPEYISMISEYSLFIPKEIIIKNKNLRLEISESEIIFDFIIIDQLLIFYKNEKIFCTNKLFISDKIKINEINCFYSEHIDQIVSEYKFPKKNVKIPETNNFKINIVENFFNNNIITDEPSNNYPFYIFDYVLKDNYFVEINKKIIEIEKITIDWNNLLDISLNEINVEINKDEYVLTVDKLSVGNRIDMDEWKYIFMMTEQSRIIFTFNDGIDNIDIFLGILEINIKETSIKKLIEQFPKSKNNVPSYEPFCNNIHISAIHSIIYIKPKIFQNNKYHGTLKQNIYLDKIDIVDPSIPKIKNIYQDLLLKNMNMNKFINLVLDIGLSIITSLF